MDSISFFLFLKYLFILAVPGLSHGTRDLSCGMHAGSSSLTRDQTQAPALGVWSLTHWTTREVPELHFLMGGTANNCSPRMDCGRLKMDTNYFVVFPIKGWSLFPQPWNLGYSGEVLRPTEHNKLQALQLRSHPLEAFPIAM